MTAPRPEPPPPARPAAAADRLAVCGLLLRGHHGVLESERREGQDFLVDLVLSLDTSRAAASDDLHDTVDYGTLVAEVASAVENDPVDLIETLAQRVADVCLRPPQVRSVEVTVHKPHAPIQARFNDVALTINRSRE